MKHLRNKNIKYLILPIILLTIAASIIITIQTYMQYQKVTIIANQKIADIIGTMLKEKPEIDTRKIIEILNSNQNTEEYKKGQAELAKYGIDTNETNSIISVQNQMKQNLISNIILIIIFSILCMGIFLVYLKKRDKKINQITQYINEIKNRNNGEDMKKYVDNFMQYRFLLSELVKKGIKLKYRRSYLGMIWSMLEPLLTMIVLTIVFGTLYGNTDRTFPVYILTGRLLYSFFSQSTKAALKSIRQNSAMIKKVYVPKYLYPLSSVLFNYVIFLISLIVLAMVSVILGVKPTFYLLQAPIALILILIMSYGCGMILATIGVFFRDMEYLWSVALMLVMYTCAIFYYPEKLLKSGWAWILKYNPLYCVIDIFRCSVFGKAMNIHYFAYALIFSVVAMVIGLFCFKKKQDDFILYI
jgi:ABC-2 type transport system permease protein